MEICIYSGIRFKLGCEAMMHVSHTTRRSISNTRFLKYLTFLISYSKTDCTQPIVVVFSVVVIVVALFFFHRFTKYLSFPRYINLLELTRRCLDKRRYTVEPRKFFRNESTKLFYFSSFHPIFCFFNFCSRSHFKYFSSMLLFFTETFRVNFGVL